MILCWQSKLGAYYIIDHLYFQRCSKHVFFQIVQLWKPRIQGEDRMLGGAYLKGEILYKEGLDGELGMGNQLIYGSTDEFQGNSHP